MEPYINGEIRPISVQGKTPPAAINIYGPQKDNRAFISSININSEENFSISLYRYTASTNKKVLVYTFSLAATNAIIDTSSYTLIEGDFMFLVVGSGTVNYSIEGSEYQKNCINPPFGSGGVVSIVTSAGSDFTGLTNEQLRAEPVAITGSISVDTAGLATSDNQALLLTELEKKADLTETQPVSLLAVPLPSGASTGTKQDEQTTLITTLNSLIENLNSLVYVLLPLGAAMNSGQPALRVNPIAAAATVVSGSVTATVASTVVSSVTNFGTGVPAKEMADDMNNLVVTMANIGNANG